MGKLKMGCLGFVGIVVLLGIIGAITGGSDKSQTASKPQTQAEQQTQPQAQQKAQQKEYAEADINTLLSEVENNAAAANKNYKGKDVKIVGGIVSNIESDADYVTIDNGASFSLVHVQCYPKSKELKDAIINLSKGQPVTVYGKITKVGEIMGYSLDLEKIE